MGNEGTWETRAHGKQMHMGNKDAGETRTQGKQGHMGNMGNILQLDVVPYLRKDKSRLTQGFGRIFLYLCIGLYTFTN